MLSGGVQGYILFLRVFVFAFAFYHFHKPSRSLLIDAHNIACTVALVLYISTLFTQEWASYCVDVSSPFCSLMHLQGDANRIFHSRSGSAA